MKLSWQKNGIVKFDIFKNKMIDKTQQREKAIKALDEWIKSNPDSRELKRAIAVKLTLQGWTYKAVSSILNVSNGFISKWKRQFEQRGIEGLKLSYKGAKSYLTLEQKQEVFDWLYQKEYWDLSELECYLIDQFDVVFKSSTSYYDLLKEAKISWQKAQSKNPRQDPEFVKKKKAMEIVPLISSKSYSKKIQTKELSYFGMELLITEGKSCKNF